MKNISKKEEFSLIKIFGLKRVEKWRKTYPILQNKDIERWIMDKIDKYTDEGKEACKFNVNGYLKPLLQYCLFNKVDNPSELLTENIDQRNLRLKMYLKEFLLNKETKEERFTEIGFRKRPSEASIRNNIQSRIKSFYSDRGANISYNMKSVKTGANIMEITLTKDIIKKIQTKLGSTYLGICKFESQTGLRIGDVLEEVTSGKYIVEKHIERYFIRNFKTMKRTVIINYLFFTKELENTLKAITGIDDLLKLDLTKLFLTRHGTRVNASDYLDRLKDIIKELGINGNIKTHAFRKYFIGAIGKCSNVLEEPRILKHFEGHEANYSDQAYLRIIKDIDTYYNEWLKTEICVCIDCIAIDKTDKEVLELREENIRLHKRMDMVLKDKIDYEERVKSEILKRMEENANKNEDKIIMKFSKNLLNALDNIGKEKTTIKKHNDYIQEKDYNSEIYTSLIAKKLIEIAKQKD